MQTVKNSNSASYVYNKNIDFDATCGKLLG